MKRRVAAVLLPTLLVLVTGCFGGAKPAPAVPTEPPVEGPVLLLSGESVKLLGHVVSFDGHRIPVTIYRPVEASAAQPVPVLLHSHGWSGTRTSTDNAFREHHRAGFGVVSIDMRGHGEARSTSAARVHHMDYEIKDVREVISQLAKLDWVRKEAADDPVIGALGGSYGGGYQLLTAATDPRVDAIAPEITWNDLLQSLAPNGAVKSAWVDILYASGNYNARLDPSIHQGFSTAQAQNRIPDGSLPGEFDLESQFRRSSPATYPSTLRVPTLLIQGINDTLFNLNEAVANLELVQSNGAEARLVTHLTGHILNTRGTIPVPAPQPVGLQTPAGGSPCGSIRNITLRWYQATLLDQNVDLGARVCLALEDATFVLADQYPPPYASKRAFELQGTASVTQLLPNSAASLPILTAPEGGLVLVGLPLIQGNASASGESIVYYSLTAKRGDQVRTLNAQVTPQRLGGALAGFAVEMGGVGARLQAGETLSLSVASTSDQFGHNTGRTPAITTLTDLRVTLPILAPS